MADWSQLPLDIVEMIAVRLDAVEDFLAFSAVCRSWRSFYFIKKWIPGPQVPWLMLSDDEMSNTRGFFSLYRDKVYELELPEASGRRCWGSSDGWLVTIGNDLEVHLLNAFTRVRIRLPAAGTFQILFNTGTLLLVDINSQVQEMVQNTPTPHLWACERPYLVESAGDLLMVYQNLYVGHMNRPPVEPIRFEVFKFDFGDREWIEIKDLENRALFVGDNISISVCASEVMKCRGNSIYFIGSKVENWWRFDEHLVDRDSGVYGMAEGTIEPFYFGADYPCYYSCPVWLTPMLVYAEGH